MRFFLILKRFKHNWRPLEGHYDTGINIYNVLADRVVPLKVRNPNSISWYTCGPTTYAESHIGHASCYVRVDLIQRILRQYFGYNVVSAMNVTDIDDKILGRCRGTTTTPEQLAKKYEVEFWRDLNSLRVVKPNMIVRVTEHIPEIVDFISRLIEQKAGYVARDGSVYFDLTKYQGYGKLVKIGGEERLKDDNKRTSRDFVMWKVPKKAEEVGWASPWGFGRPGWHIECSVLASAIFGDSIDIHAGGSDLKFPHHENEEAQSCCYHRKSHWVNYWIHTGHLHLKDSTKMSKSLGNTIQIAELLKVVRPEVFRMACVQTHYRHLIEFTDDLLQTAGSNLRNLHNFRLTCDNYLNNKINPEINEVVLQTSLHEARAKVDEALRNDFNTPNVVRALSELTRTCSAMLHSNSSATIGQTPRQSVAAINNFVGQIMTLFAIDEVQRTEMHEPSRFDELLQVVVHCREEIRRMGIAEKHSALLGLSDDIRNELRKINVQINDLPQRK